MHGHWGMSQKHPGKVVFRGRKWDHDKTKLYGPTELFSVLQEISRAQSAFWSFATAKLLPTLKALSEHHVKFIIDMEKRKDRV
jgi:hypothetical protein